MKRNWKQKNEIKIRKNISFLMDELNAFEQRMDERLTDEMKKISSIERQVNQILPILKDSVETEKFCRDWLENWKKQMQIFWMHKKILNPH